MALRVNILILGVLDSESGSGVGYILVDGECLLQPQSNRLVRFGIEHIFTPSAI